MFWSSIFKFEIWNILIDLNFLHNRRILFLYLTFCIQIIIQSNEIVVSANENFHNNCTIQNLTSLNMKNKISTKNDNRLKYESKFYNKLTSSWKKKILNQEVASKKIMSDRRLIVLHGFNKIFKLKLYPLDNDFLSNEKYKVDPYHFESMHLNNSTFSKNASQKENCLYSGYVNEDKLSKAFVNLCNQGNIYGTFRSNKTDYFINPESKFKDFKQTTQNILDKENIISSEVFYALIDDQVITFQTHVFYTKSQNLTVYNSTDSCLFLREDDKTSANMEKNLLFNNLNSKLIWDELNDRLNDNESTEVKENLKRVRRSSVEHHFPHVLDKNIYLELLVVVDKKMKDYYGNNLENHILTLMFLTTQMYQHPSIINPVRIYLTDIIYISELENRSIENLHIVWDAEKTLSSFCEWQNNFVRSNNMIKPDLSILITKEDICKSSKVCQTLGNSITNEEIFQIEFNFISNRIKLGMAKLGQVCVSGQNCALIEDSGINTAYTIAHEIGHLIGMKHAEESNCKNLNSHATQMMASVLDLTKTEYEWSNCSVAELNDFLRLDTDSCMLNVPKRNSDNLNNIFEFEDTLEQFNDEIKFKATFPGELQAYELKNQCQQIFGPESDVCDHNLDIDCKVLWCKAGHRSLDNTAIHCVTTNTKWADGTSCAIHESAYHFRSKKICMNGNCVLKSSEEVRVVDGQWSNWGDFTECSRSCGGGVKKRYRSCKNPRPKNGGKYCIGKRYDYVSCNIEKCADTSDYRDLQCVLAAMKASKINSAQLNGFSNISPNTWKAYYSQDPKKNCQLMCKPEESNNFVTFKSQVIDGTKCNTDTNDVCVNGFCVPAGCDNILYSNKQFDNCGVCNGDNNSCDEISQMIQVPTAYGYNRVLDIPPKATNIHIIRKRSLEDLGCLALKTNRDDSTYILNGHYVISKSTLSTKFEGIRIDYIVDDSKEIIKSVGNFSEPLEVQFLAGSINNNNNGVINYLFYIQKNNQKSGNNEHVERISNQNLIQKDVPLKYTHKSSNNNFMSQTGLKSKGEPCNKLCNGIEKIQVQPKCSDNPKEVGTQICPIFDEEVKYIERPCNTHCQLHLFSSPGRCLPKNGTCGVGLELPNLRCIKHEKNTNRGYEVDLLNCDKYEIYKANTSYARDCQIPCELYKWQEINSMCSVTCGSGYKFKYYKCLDIRTNKLADSIKCMNIPKPESVYIKCDQPCYNWQTSSWKPCSVSCGNGIRKREIYCVFNNQNVVSNSFCDQKIPENTESCNTHDCPTWVSHEWNECSCETGQRNRLVVCMYNNSQISHGTCSSLLKPNVSEQCIKNDCPVWKYGNWSNCSALCGPGFKTREVYCAIESKYFIKDQMSSNDSIDINSSWMNLNSQVKETKLDRSKCSELAKPPDSIECSINKECHEWRTSYWTSCSVTCGRGIRMRRVYCSGRIGDCSHSKKPANIEHCQVKPCMAEWKAEKWSKCNGNCNYAWQTRNVVCIDQENKITSNSYCANKPKPFTRQKCVDCGKWKTEEWSECSVSCGEGFRSRTVKCYSDELDLLTNNKCDLESKPDLIEKCTNFCPKEPEHQWKIILYGKCSVKCGIGWKFRHIECKSRNGSSSDLCKLENKPKYYEQCNSGACPKWEFGDWSPCSRKCGKGVQRRLVVCREINGTILDESYCEHLKKPTDSLDCAGITCGEWKVSNWSNCDLKTCTTSRTVTCKTEKNDFSESFCDLDKKPPKTEQCSDTNNCKKHQKYLVTSYNHSVLYTGVLSYTNWSICSLKCGKGTQTRDPICLLANKQSIVLPIAYCDTSFIESTFRDCELKKCSYQLIQKWGKCSKPCKQRGVQILKQKCYEKYTKKFHDLSFCSITNDTKKTRTCYGSCNRQNQHNIWRVGPWENCSTNCGYGFKTRKTFCWNKYLRKEVDRTSCLEKYEPSASLPCITESCGYGWTVSTWSSCSTKCSLGYKYRTVKCTHFNKEGIILNDLSNKCDITTKPINQIPCNYGKCDGDYFWKPGKWSSCIPNCGFGYQKRFIYCIASNGTKIDSKYCDKEYTPINAQQCFTNCYSKSCLDLKNVYGIKSDGEYNLKISESIISIYCYNMNTDQPLEFVTLPSGESQNFAEIYEKKLIEPTKCKFGPRYSADCSFCTNDTVPNHGITLFSKIRIDILTLKIIDDDFTFSKIKYGEPVPFGTAGDCYSSMPDCQQARLNINLRGTGFVLANEVKWVNYGEKAFSKINFSKDKSTIYGKCGGLCGFCKPDPMIGIQLMIAD